MVTLILLRVNHSMAGLTTTASQQRRPRAANRVVALYCAFERGLYAGLA